MDDWREIGIRVVGLARKLVTTPSVVDSDGEAEVAGVLVEPRQPVALYEAIAYALEHNYAPSVITGFAERYSWESNAETVMSQLQSAE